MRNLIQRWFYFGIIYTSVSPQNWKAMLIVKKWKKSWYYLLIDAILSWSIGDTVERILISFEKKKKLKEKCEQSQNEKVLKSTWSKHKTSKENSMNIV